MKMRILMLSFLLFSAISMAQDDLKGKSFLEFLSNCINTKGLTTLDEIKKHCKGDYDSRLSAIEKYRNNLPLDEKEKVLFGLKPPKDFEGEIIPSAKWMKDKYTKPLMSIYLHKMDKNGVNKLEIYSLHKYMSAQLFISCALSKHAAIKKLDYYYLGTKEDTKLKQNAQKTVFYAYFPKDEEKPNTKSDIKWTEKQFTNTYRDICKKTLKSPYTW